MAAPILRRYGTATMSAGTWTAVHATVPANRALVVSKIVVSNNSTSVSQTFYLSINTTANGGAGTLATAVTLAVGSVYTETGLVCLTGEAVNVFSTNANGVAVTVCGEEVDN